MSIYGAAHVALLEEPSYGPIWRAGIQGGKDVTLNEGDSMAFILQLLNPVEGARFVWAMTNSSGSTINASNWVDSITTVFNEVLTAAGLSFEVLSTTTSPARTFTLDMLIGMPTGSNYAGQLLTMNLRSRKNLADDVNPRSSQCVLTRKAFSTDPDIVNHNFGGNYVTILDTSRTPTGAPILTIGSTALNGVDPAKTTYQVGQGFQLQISGQNIIPGTKLKMYAAGAAQYWLDPSFRSAMMSAISPPKAPPGITFEQTKYPPPVGQAWYNGYTIVFDGDYDGSTIEWNCIYDQVSNDGTATELDIIASIVAEGTVSDLSNTQAAGNWGSSGAYNYGDIITYVPTGQQYVAIQAVPANTEPDTNSQYWRPYTATHVLGGGGTTFVQLPPPTYWEIRATVSGSTVNYTLRVPPVSLHAGVEQVDFDYTNAPGAFLGSLQNAASQSGSPVDFGNGKFTTNSNCSSENFVLTWQAGISGTSGKHTVSLRNSTNSPITIGDGCVFLSAFTKPSDPTYITGVSNSGGEFGKVPGVYGTDYRYPSTPEADSYQHQPLDYLWALGIRFMRLPVRWNRIQQNGQFTPLSGEKDPSTPWDKSTSFDIARIDDIIDYWTNLGGVVLFDLHNYGARGSDGQVGYDQAVPMSALIDVWQTIALRYQGNQKVWFGLMNEPSGGGWGPTRCRENMQWIINAIRGFTDAKNKILVGGTAHSSATSWTSNGQSDAYNDFYDPAGNFAFEPHCYFDSDASGQSGACVANSQSRLISITGWARTQGFKLFLGETAGGDPAISGQAACGSVVPAAYSYMQSNKDVWLGWSTWGYGPRWPSTYPYLLNPSDYTNTAPSAASPCMKMFVPYIAESS